MSELENKAEKIAQAIVEGSRSKASPADISRWSDEIYAAYQKNPDSPEVKECQQILSDPVERHIKPLMPFLEVFCGIKRR
jgi:hypothetical protein